MAREGYLILDSDLHMMEPDDLWARYLDEPYRANAPRFFGAQHQKLADDSEDKDNADVIEGMEVQGLSIPAHGNVERRGVTARIAAQKQGRSSALQCRAGSRLRSGLDPDGDGYRRDRCGGNVWHPRAADSVSR